MISTNGKVFILDTKNLSYVFHTDELGLLFHDYFGEKVEIKNFDITALKQKLNCAKGTAVLYNEKVNPNVSMDYSALEFSFPHKGDYRSTPVLLKNQKSGFVFDFQFASYEINEKPEIKSELPVPHDISQELVIRLKEVSSEIYIELHYLVFEESDTFARSMTIINNSDILTEVLKASSLSLDIMNKDYEAVNFTGAWASEMHEQVSDIKVGRIVQESLTGFSSHKVSPLFMIKGKQTGLNSGEAYIFNLIYSGNHIHEIELNTYGILRIENGISPFCFNFLLNKEEKFDTPYAVFTYSNKGLNDARQHMHHFVNNHITPKEFKEVVRPVVINNWEGTYFKFKESKLLKIAKGGLKYGVELFVLDDGWFSTRNDDTQGLGDYDVNKKKLPGGLLRLSNKIHKKGMKFGLWFEPESVNQNSKLYKEHPEWAIANEGHDPALCRHQLLLDLSKVEVQDYIIENISHIIEEAKLDYIKWDMNRHMSDIPNQVYNGTFFHKYILGLYRVMRTLTEKYPHVLFEGCASGGNRFDLGILTYFPQIWASDDTDALERLRIQRNYSFGFPLSTLSNHVSTTPNHQTLRTIPMDTRFDVAMFGILGYELLFNEVNKFERERATKLIEVYKNYREVFQYGEFSEIENTENNVKWQVASKDKSSIIVFAFNKLQNLIPQEDSLTTIGALPDSYYTAEVVDLNHDIREFGGLVNMLLPFHVNPHGKLVDLAAKFIKLPAEKDSYVVQGKMLNSGAVKLTPEWSASGVSDGVRVLRDFGARLYVMRKVDETQ